MKTRDISSSAIYFTFINELNNLKGINPGFVYFHHGKCRSTVRIYGKSYSDIGYYCKDIKANHENLGNVNQIFQTVCFKEPVYVMTYKTL